VLVEERLAACVNVLPAVASLYWWEGRVQDDTEATLLLKVPTTRLEALKARIHELHSYQTVEILVLVVDVDRSDPAYVAWVRSFG
jgi:periplasmic divalent cation tolerance protein